MGSIVFTQISVLVKSLMPGIHSQTVTTMFECFEGLHTQEAFDSRIKVANVLFEGEGLPNESIFIFISNLPLKTC